MAQQSVVEQEIGPDEEAVAWLVQPPNGVTLYVMSSGRVYRVRNMSEIVIINRADRPELESLGYIAPKGV